jgi:ubiquitin carboxyl-terminal hydrolase 3
MHHNVHFPDEDASDAGSVGSDQGKKRKRLTLINGKAKKKTGAKYKTITGLLNLGNTCFMNAVMQSLSHTDALREFVNVDQGKTLVSLEPSSPRSTRRTVSPTFVPKEGVSLWNDFYALIREMLYTTDIVINPGVFLQSLWTVVPMFKGYQQQDAQEFLRYLLERLHGELDPRNDVGSVIHSMFMGKLQSRVMCLSCKNVSKKEDAFMDLSLAIPDVFANRRNKVEELQNPCTLSNCLDDFFGTETLDEREKYLCTACKDMERVSKQFTITKLPNVLCLHIKRFKYSRSLRTKIDTYVAFPVLELDMEPYVVYVHLFVLKS